MPEQCFYILIFCHVMMVLIDRAFKELSNGCHIVNFDYFDFIDEILALEPDLDLLVTF